MHEVLSSHISPRARILTQKANMQKIINQEIFYPKTNESDEQLLAINHQTSINS